MIINKSKFERQKESINKWINADCIGSLELTMQFGKTMIGAIATNYFIKGGKDVVIVVPSEIIYKGWKKSFNEYFRWRS